MRLSSNFYAILLSKTLYTLFQYGFSQDLVFISMRIIFISSISIVVMALLFWTRPDTYAELQDLPPPTVNLDTVMLQDIQPHSWKGI